MVCDKVVCERRCVKDESDGVWQSCVWKMVCEKLSVTVCERWCVCVKDVVSKMVCDKGVCERWCVKNSVWQSCVWKMVCQRWCVKDGVDGVWQSADKDGVSQMGCERWCGTKWCVKDSVWQSGVWKMVCGEVVCERLCLWCVKDGVWQSGVKDGVRKCERWCVTKWCVKDSVWQSGLCKMVCDKVVCERWCGTKWCERWCVKVGVSRMVSERWCETNLCEKDSVSKMMWRLCVLRLPRERQPRPQRRPRAPQLLQEALCTAPATRKAAAAPAAATRAAARPGGAVYCACHAKGTRGPSGRHARRSSSRRLCVLRLPRQRQPRPQRRPRAPQLVQEALCTAPATPKAAAAPAAATRAAARPGGSVYCACHAKGSRGPSGGHSARRLCASATQKASSLYCACLSEWVSAVSEWRWVSELSELSELSEWVSEMKRRRRRRGEAAAPAGSKRKTRTPHSDVGNSQEKVLYI